MRRFSRITSRSYDSGTDEITLEIDFASDGYRFWPEELDFFRVHGVFNQGVRHKMAPETIQTK